MTSKVLESKRAYRRSLPVSRQRKSFRILEEMRGRAQMRQGSRQSALPKPPAAATDFEQNPQIKDSTKKRSVGLSRSKATVHRFGGRATAGGVNYEVRVAAFIAVKMLSGSQCSVWDGINGADLSAITMQAPEPVEQHCREFAWRHRRVRLHFRKGTQRNHCTYKEKSGLCGHHPQPSFNSSENCLLRHVRKVVSSGQFRVAWVVQRHTSCLTFSKRTARMLATLHYQSFYVVGRQKKGGVKSVADGGNECVENTIRKFANGRRATALSSAGVCGGI